MCSVRGLRIVFIFVRKAMERIIVVLLLAWGLTGCGQGQVASTKEATGTTVVTYARLLEEIQALEAQLIKAVDAKKDIPAAEALIEKSTTFAKEFPVDTLAPLYLFRAAEVSRGIGEYGKAIKLWGDMRDMGEEHRLAAKALFLQGFVYDNDLSDPDNAKIYYREFLEQYPDDPIAPEVEKLLKVINTSPEDLIKSFQKNVDQGNN
jgi:tetratricopeptide (TPR) repeat protein